jgi:hypothetical protein
MILPAVLFVLFALFAAAGAYLAAVGPKGRRFALVAALVVLAFFVALGFGVVTLIRQGMSGG